MYPMYLKLRGFRIAFALELKDRVIAFPTMDNNYRVSNIIY